MKSHGGLSTRRSFAARYASSIEAGSVAAASAANAGHARPADSGTGRVELRTVVLEVAIEIPDHRVGVEIRSIMKLHAMPQMEDPGFLVVRGLLVFLCQPRSKASQPVGAGEVPKHKSFEDRIAEK